LCRFVSSITASPTVRLDLNDGALWAVSADGLDLSPPPMRRSVVSTMLRDGEPISASAYGNRTLVLPLDLQASTEDAAWTAQQALWAELNRPTNILQLQLGGVPVFFKTYRAPDSVLELVSGRVMNQRITLAIPAEPFALGLAEAPSPPTVTNNPAAGSNGQFFDLTGVKGDVETPLRITIPAADINGRAAVVFATRRGGTPSNMPFVLQAEAMPTSTDTSLPGNDALMSGSGSNYARTTFAGTPAASTRLSYNPWPVSASVDNRGTYRVFARIRKSVNGDAIDAYLTYGPMLISTGTVRLPANTVLQYVDMGLINFPAGADPVDDTAGVAQTVAGQRIDWVAGRVSGSGNLDLDHLLFMPADDSLLLANTTDANVIHRGVFDGVKEMFYGITSGGDVSYSGAVPLPGGFPYVSPGVTNRVFYLKGLNGTTDPITATTVLTLAYWPRYLLVPGS